MLSHHQIRQALKAGTKPEDLPGFKQIGSGSYRVAFGDGRFVVKSWVGRDRLGPSYQTFTTRRARSVRVKLTPDVENPLPWHGEYTDYLIQRQYAPLLQQPVKNYAEYRNTLKTLSPEDQTRINRAPDGHVGNFGRDHKGRLVQFDW